MGCHVPLVVGGNTKVSSWDFSLAGVKGSKLGYINACAFMRSAHQAYLVERIYLVGLNRSSIAHL